MATVACIWCGTPIDFVTAEAIHPDGEDELTCFHDPGSTKRHEDTLRTMRSCARAHLTNLKEIRALGLGPAWQAQWDWQVKAFKEDREHIHELMVLVQISKEIENGD